MIQQATVNGLAVHPLTLIISTLACIAIDSLHMITASFPADRITVSH